MMSSDGAAPVLVVIYARDVARVAEFYSRTLSRPVTERSERYVLVGDGDAEVAVVRMPDGLVAGHPTAIAPRLREETPIKPSFLVEDLEEVIRATAASGGGTKSMNAVWSWRGQRHLDGHDPEGNPVQFRVHDDDAA